MVLNDKQDLISLAEKGGNALFMLIYPQSSKLLIKQIKFSHRVIVLS